MISHPALRRLPRAALLPLALLVLAPPGAGAQEELEPREIAARTVPAVVTVESLDAAGRRVGQGSGFFVSEDGVLVTNLHVVEDAEALRVRLGDGEVHEEVYFVAADAGRDLAVLRVPVAGARPLPLGRDTEARMGDRVYVMGNPLGMERTFSDGLVSARRTVAGVQLLQISAPISPGSSGGPVLNARGEVIGVATLTLSEGQNLNLAVPVRYLRPLLATGDRPRRFARHLLPGRTAGPVAVADAEGGESPWMEQAREQVLVMGRVLEEEEGFTLSHDLFTGSLDHGGTDAVSLKLRAGETYAIVGACDEDCTDVDLGLAEDGGELLKRDVREDDYPVVVFRPRRTGEYTLIVHVAECSSEPCAFAVGVFSR